MDSKISIDNIIENLRRIHSETNFNYIRYLKACGSKLSHTNLCNDKFQHFALFFKEGKIDWWEKVGYWTIIPYKECSNVINSC